MLPLKSLVGKLNEPCRRSLEDAAGLCLSRTNYNVEVEHWLLKQIEMTGTDLAAIFKHFDVHVPTLSRDLTQIIERFKTGNGRAPGLSQTVVDWIREAWMFGSVHYQASAVRSGHLLAALLAEDSLARIGLEISAEIEKISPEALHQALPSLTEDTIEHEHGSAPLRRGRHDRPIPAGAPGSAAALDQFTVDLTELARDGRIDPVLGRDSEIRQIVDILTRRRQNNPILTGEAGVGKTAVVEGFAQRIADEDVPPALQGVAVRTLDLGLLQAGAGIKGEFENRLKSVIDEVKASPQPIILFIDEAHTMIGAGGQAGQGDAANLLKPALARGELRTIAATTWAEYKKYFEKDAALARRFQVIKVEEPSEESGVQMMRGLVGTLEEHHGVRILDEAVVDAVKLSKRYISGRQLPDKSVSLIDTACARVAISQSAIPPAIEDRRRVIEQRRVETDILQREVASGADHSERLGELKEQTEKAERNLADLEARWEREKELIGEIHKVHRQLNNGEVAAPAGDDTASGEGSGEAANPAVAAASSPNPGLTEERRGELRRQLKKLEAELRQVQGESPLMHVFVDSQAIAEVVAGWTGIPVGRMVTDEINAVLSLRQHMEERIIGQSHALEAIAQSIRTSRASLTDPRKPIGVFLMVGSSGVGKTETAIVLSELLYGGDQNMTVINMSEFKEEHKVSLLMGSPPGYVGYGEGGVLTEAVRRRPYSVVLLDEMEKAHPGVQDIFYQVFDKGMLRDGEGRDIDFKNTVILMTSNAGTDLITSMCSDPETQPDPEALTEALHQELLKTFKPAFLGRVTVIPYYPLAPDVMKSIVRLQLGRIERRVRDAYRASFSYSDDLVDSIAARCSEVSTGARNVDHILTRSLLPELSAELLARMGQEKPVSRVRVSVDGQSGFNYEID